MKAFYDLMTGAVSQALELLKSPPQHCKRIPIPFQVFSQQQLKGTRPGGSLYHVSKCTPVTHMHPNLIPTFFLCLQNPAHKFPSSTFCPKCALNSQNTTGFLLSPESYALSYPLACCLCQFA